MQAYARANRLFEQNQLPQSMAALEEALAADPNNVPALTLKAKIAIGANRFDMAGECLERAVAADPSSWYARFLYGFWYYLRDDWSRALAELNAAHKLNPRVRPFAALSRIDLRAPRGFTESHRLFRRSGPAGGSRGQARCEQPAGIRAASSTGRTVADCGKVLDKALNCTQPHETSIMRLGACC